MSVRVKPKGVKDNLSKIYKKEREIKKSNKSLVIDEKERSPMPVLKVMMTIQLRFFVQSLWYKNVHRTQTTLALNTFKTD